MSIATNRTAASLAAIALMAAGVAEATAETARSAHPAWLERAAGTPQAPAAPAPSQGEPLQTFPDLAAFQAATAGLPMAFENFAIRDPLNISPCYEPINHLSGQPGTNFLAPTCFRPDHVIPGFSIRSDLGVGSHGFSTSAIGAQTFGGASNVVGAMPPAAATLISFADGPVAVALDAYDWLAGAPLSVWVYGVDDHLIDSFNPAPQSAPNVPTFAGFISPAPVGRVEVRNGSGTAQVIGNLRFGGRAGTLVAEARALDFGYVGLGTDAERTLTLSNAGDLPLTVDAIAAPAAPYSIANDGCSENDLAPGASCIVEVRFEPMLARAYTQTLLLSAGSAEDEDVPVELAGRGAVPGLTLSRESVAFGVVPVGGTSAAQSVELRNLSAGEVTVEALSALAAPFQLAGGSCGALPVTLAPGDACTLDFTVTPSVAGAQRGYVLIDTDAPSGPVSIDFNGHTDDGIFANGFQ